MFAASVGIVGIGPLHVESFLAVQESQPDGLGVLTGADNAPKLQQYSRARAGVISSDKIIDSFCIVVRCIHNNIWMSGRNFDQDILHRHVANRSGRMKVLLFDGATETLKLFDDVSLRAANPFAAGRVRSDGDQPLNVFVSTGAVESTGRFSGRRTQGAGKRGGRGSRCVDCGRGLVAASHHRKDGSDNGRTIGAETGLGQSRSHGSRSLAY